MGCDGEGRWKRNRATVMRLIWDILYLNCDLGSTTFKP